ncbi:hypothetical protein AVEN_166963-1 [Araneus ventricosus]|uniref:F-box domain-containing protein n=1 Tax=Araneus ventricosus TaxID=182803 RepID=A0A4Y2K6U7_ARAVE|nr:hypothetical protein AVEN_166963-1 [Araneus ventricosus]
MECLPTEMDSDLSVYETPESGSTDSVEEFDKQEQWTELPSPKIIQKVLFQFYNWIVLLLKWIPSSMDCFFHYFGIQSAEMVDSTEERDKQAQWAELPSLPLERIYSFLSRHDQINMSQVCRKWSEGFNSPSVWETFRFSLTESQLLMDPCPKIKCAEKYSRLFRHVEIDFIRTVNEYLIETFCKRLIVLLDILTRNSQLISLKVRWLEFFFLSDTMKCEVQKAIDPFFKSQHQLKKVQFHSSYFAFQDDDHLNDTKVDNRCFPTHFVLRRFIDPIESMDQENTLAAQNLHALLCERFKIFRRLPTLQTDYSFIYNSTSTSQSDAGDTLENSSFSKVILNCYGSIPEHYRGLSSSAWRFRKQLCSDLQVELYFETDSQSRRDIEFLIVPDMPITQLDYRFTVCKSEHASIMEIDALFNHLHTCKINEHLVSLRLAWILPIPDLASIFIPFLQDCKKLKRFQLFIIYPANGIDLLARSWLENRPESLEEVSIDVSHVGNEDNYRGLKNLVTEYVSLLKLVGLNLEAKLNFGKTIFRESI